MPERETKSCDECGSLYFANTSHMAQLCPECAHLLYGYKPCDHLFHDGRCSHCWWDGSISKFCQSLKRKDPPGDPL